MAPRQTLKGWTVVREYHPDLDPDGTPSADEALRLLARAVARGLANAWRERQAAPAAKPRTAASA